MKKITKLAAMVLAFTATAANAQFFEKVDYVGALSNDASKDWTSGWTQFNPKQASYASVTDTTTLNAMIGTGEILITSTLTLDSTKVYLLKGLIVVKNGGKLVIPAGTLIRCQANILSTPKNYASVVVERGGMIQSNGRKDKPVVFTSAKAAGSRDRGDWGGILLAGKAVNNQGTDVQMEGFNNVAFDNTLAKHGGSTDDDNSGSITYTRIEFGGFAFEVNKEINGLTFCSVGNKTTIDNIQVSFSGDDSYEWFGGTVRCKHLIAYNGTDDDFDTDFGYRGAVQFGIGHRDSAYYDLTWAAPSGGSTSEGFESDNDASGSWATPFTSAVFSNMTMVGPVPVGSTWSAMSTVAKSAFRRGARIRRNSRLSIVNSIFMGYRNFVMYDGTATLKASGIVDSVFNSPDTMLFHNNIIVNTASAFTPASSTANGLVEVVTGNSNLLARFNSMLQDSRRSNRINTVTYTSGTLLIDPKNTTAPDFRPISTSAALTGSDFTYKNFDPYGVLDPNASVKAKTISHFGLYPNPATNELTIEFSAEIHSDGVLKITDLSGRVVKQVADIQTVAGKNSMHLNISDLHSGMYFITLESAAGKVQSTVLINR